MIFKNYADDTVSCEFTTAEYRILMALTREIFGSMPKEDFGVRIGAGPEEVATLGRTMRAEGERFDIYE